MARDPDPADVFALLDDEYARGILRATKHELMSAPELATELNASRPTIYRRIEQLQELDLLEESTEFDPNGHHRNVYEATLESLTVTLGDGFSVAVTRSEHPADALTDLWEGL